MLVSSRSAAKPRADVQRILLEDGNHTTMIRKKKKDCQLTSIVIGEVCWFSERKELLLEHCHSRFGDAILRADHGAILPSKVQDFCGPLPTFSFCVGLVFPGGSKLLPKGKRVGW